MKKILTLVVALVMALSLAIPAMAAPFDGEYPILDEKVSLTIGIGTHANVEDWETNWQTLLMEELANVDVTFEVYGSEMLTQLTLAITSGAELPDILINNKLGLDLLYQWALAGAIIPLNEYVENDAYFIKDAIERTGVNFLPMVTSPDGNLYTLPQYNQSLTNEANDKIWVYQAWLDKLNLQAPTNADELYNVLKAFKEQDPNGNGEADEIPLIASTNNYEDSWWQAIMNMFIYVPDKAQSVKDGNVFYYAATEEYREGLKYIRKLLDEGLVDPMTFTADKTQVAALVNQEVPVVGMHMGAANFGTVNTPRIGEYVGIEPFKNAAGEAVTTFYPSLPVPAAVITADCENPEAAVTVLDLFYRDDMSIINHWGEEGKHWERAPEGLKASMKNMDIDASFKELEALWGTVQNIMWYQNGPWAREYAIASGRIIPENPLTTAYGAAQIQYAYSAAYPAEDEYIPRFIYTEEESDAVSMTITDLETYIKTARTNFMMNAEGMDIYSDEAWNAYLEQLKVIGMEEVLEVQQAVYDRMYK